MKKATKLILMLCLILSGALSYAHNAVATRNEKDGRPVSIELTESTGVSSSDKSGSIGSIIDGHVLTVVFTENLGHVTVEVTTTGGAVVETAGLYTPNGACLHIPDTGSYVVTFTLPNGDIYYGEFEVID